jgi:hypothetical protein
LESYIEKGEFWSVSYAYLLTHSLVKIKTTQAWIIVKLVDFW